MPTDKHSALPARNRISSVYPLLTAILFLSLIACAGSNKNNSDPEPIIDSGGSLDSYGCLSSGGFSWSALRKECIRFWETGIELTDALRPNATSVAYIVTANDTSNIELFLPRMSGSILLSKKDGNWVDSENRYSLSKSNEGIYQLHNTKGILLYQSGKS
ncbi:MAG: hypothetical protein HEP71_03655 [Roseivirga sp.]|nr:hypothetical protein [Roseivirga sp.]